MPVFLLLLAAMVAVTSIYDYFYMKRVADFWKLPFRGKWGKVVLFLLTVLLVAPITNIFGVWAVIVLYMSGLILVIDLLNILVQKTVGTKELWNKIYRSGLIPVVVLLLVIGYSFFNMRAVRETDYTIYTEKAIREEGYKICLISDLHYPTTMNASKLEEYCSQISSKNVDAVVLCGDIVDERSKKAEMEEAFQILSGITTKYGIYYVYGNHDRALYSENPPFTEAELAEAIETTGIKILNDEAAALNDEFVIIGRNDRSYPLGRKTSEELLEGVDRDGFLLLLDHQPVGLAENAAAGYDLQLSGHTHAGQMWPVGPITELFHWTELNYGYRKDGNFQAIVTSGIAGWGYPLRTGKHSEYVMIDIFSSESKHNSD